MCVAYFKNPGSLDHVTGFLQLRSSTGILVLSQATSAPSVSYLHREQKIPPRSNAAARPHLAQERSVVSASHSKYGVLLVMRQTLFSKSDWFRPGKMQILGQFPGAGVSHDPWVWDVISARFLCSGSQ
ncbi:hypothetical protein CIRG_05031 [Coccidioides immitis RMSCC 2394]|uniref:Uncharacterized protein n=1 Tax=Coccidioides immitis RMSCC 2394 TaxID=404692 RepID=A0A0J6YC78_COCIT|nr:hypothetical protein CIRG_05031 [Coccidioides immitis RMSCC 2394]